MAKLDQYENAFRFARFERNNGVLEVTLHTDGGPLQWGLAPHEELPRIFRAVSDDRDNRVVILTGAGDDFIGPRVTAEARTHAHNDLLTSDQWDSAFVHGRRLEMDLLDIEVPVIAAINGPVWRHMELPLMSDIVLASETAKFEDRAHFQQGNLVPGDGISLVLATLMGWNRARYLQLMGQTLDADEAHKLGMVSEVLPKAQVLERAREIGQQLAKKPTLLLRYTRLVFTQEMKKRMADHLPLALAVEGLNVISSESRKHGFD